MNMKQIPGYPNYFLTESGEVYSNKKGVLKKLLGGTTKDGYKNIKAVNSDGKWKTLTVNRLMKWTYFNCFTHNDDRYTINHIDGNKLNNNLYNLELVSRQKNVQHAFDTKLRTHKGENNTRTLLTEKDVRGVKSLLKIGVRQIDIARIFKVKRGLIYSIKAGRTWKHLI